MADSTSCFHVAGVLVQVKPEELATVHARIVRMAGARVHATDPSGKLVVTIESERLSELADCHTRLQTMRGVVSAVLVSEHAEPLAAAGQETNHESFRQEPP